MQETNILLQRDILNVVFSSIAFIFYFLPVFLIGYVLLARSTESRNIVFLLFSLIFYAWGEAIYVLVMLISIIGNYYTGRLITRRRRPSSLALGIAYNIILLVAFKYANFLVETVTGVSALLGSGEQTGLNIHLPLGISFFTFQAMSYLIDVYRKDAEAEPSLINLALYISMFPQLIAGPIVRFQSIQDQLHARRLTIDKAYRGAQLFVVGLAQKVLIADTLARPADQIFGLPTDQLSTALAWFGAGAYGLQIYFDFAGYSTMAIGLGLIAGFQLPRNFNYPYISQSVTEFWRRWHMTLSRWFRDYLYIPLGGNRRGAATTYRNLLIVFILCGFWHGAAWNFLVWGLWHGGFLIIERSAIGRWVAAGLATALFRPLRHLYLLLVVLIGWVFFRAADLPHAGRFLAQMFGLGEGQDRAMRFEEFLWRDSYIVAAALAGIVLATPCIAALTAYRNMDDGDAYAMQPRMRRAFPYVLGALLGAATILVIVGQTYSPFIYFRF